MSGCRFTFFRVSHDGGETFESIPLEGCCLEGDCPVKEWDERVDSGEEGLNPYPGSMLRRWSADECCNCCNRYSDTWDERIRKYEELRNGK